MGPGQCVRLRRPASLVPPKPWWMKRTNLLSPLFCDSVPCALPPQRRFLLAILPRRVIAHVMLTSDAPCSYSAPTIREHIELRFHTHPSLSTVALLPCSVRCRRALQRDILGTLVCAQIPVFVENTGTQSPTLFLSSSSCILVITHHTTMQRLRASSNNASLHMTWRASFIATNYRYDHMTRQNIRASGMVMS